MAAMKPRTGDGPLEVTKEGRGIVMRVPLEGGGRLVVELTPDEARALGNALNQLSAECSRGCLLTTTVTAAARHRPEHASASTCSRDAPRAAASRPT